MIESVALLKHDVELKETEVGTGVFAQRAFPEEAVIGEIEGELIDDPNAGGDYVLSLGDRWSLEPAAPFRFLNHSCEPNCEFDYWDIEDPITGESFPHAFLISLREIQPGEQLTIDYNWPASYAIPCKCGAASCRGWIVVEDELCQL